MQLDQAIYELEDGLRQLRGYLNKDYNDAIELGVEALKDLRKHRKYPHSGVNPKLPGETKD